MELICREVSSFSLTVQSDAAAVWHESSSSRVTGNCWAIRAIVGAAEAHLLGSRFYSNEEVQLCLRYAYYLLTY